MLEGGFVATYNMVVVHFDLGNQSGDESLGDNLFAGRVLGLFDKEVTYKDTSCHIHQVSGIKIVILAILFIIKIGNSLL